MYSTRRLVGILREHLRRPTCRSKKNAYLLRNVIDDRTQIVHRLYDRSQSGCLARAGIAIHNKNVVVVTHQERRDL